MSGHNPAGKDIALDLLEHSPAVSLRLAGTPGDSKVLFITHNIRQFGYDADAFLSGALAWEEVIHPEDVDAVIDQLNDYEDRHIDTYSLTYRICTKEGRSIWVNDASTRVRDKSGKLLYVDAIVTDHSQIVADKNRVEDSLQQQRVLTDILQALHASATEEAFQIILERTGEYLGISRATLFEDNADHTAATAVYEWTGPGTTPVIGLVVDYKRDLPDIEGDLIETGCLVADYGCLPEESAEILGRLGIVATALFTVYHAGERYGYLAFDESDKQRVWQAGTLTFLKNVSKLVSTALVRKSNEENIRRMAYQDQLTGLVNRHRFDHYLEAAMADARRTKQEGYVLFIDMDDFKVVNEGYGHDYGDALLVAVADYLRSAFGDFCSLFRFGGDEFVVLVDRQGAQKVQEIIGEILLRARHPWQTKDRAFYCTVSIGVVRFSGGDDSVTEVIKNADIALYQAKSLGKNSFVFYNRSLDNNSVQRAETEHHMREDIEQNFRGFLVYYQPIVDVAGEVVGAEALARWQMRDGELVAPVNFIPLAEYLGLIIPLGEHVLREAALECRRINDVHPDFFISVNVSIRQLQQHDFVQRVDAILRQTGARAQNIVLEVTEGMLVQDLEHMRTVLESLRALGLSIAMDDFGTGYSSLNNMRELPLDIIKIDRSFIRDLSTDDYSKTFVRLICDLCHSMGRTVCAEGVEDSEQLRYCAECHTDTIQGFYFFRPMPENELDKLLLGGGPKKRP